MKRNLLLILTVFPILLFGQEYVKFKSDIPSSNANNAQGEVAAIWRNYSIAPTISDNFPNNQNWWTILQTQFRDTRYDAQLAFGLNKQDLWLRFNYDDNWQNWKKVVLEDQDGNVGIGTISPSTRLHISGLVESNYLQILETQAGNISANGLGISIDDNATNGHALRIMQTTDGLWNSGNPKELFEIAYDGKVGIGTTTASNKVDIEDDVNGTLALEVTNRNTGNKARRGIMIGNGTSGNSAYFFSTSPNYDQVPSWQNSAVLGSDSQLSNGLVLRTSSGGIRFQPNGTTDKIVFNSNGCVGIGTDLMNNPNNYKLAVNGTIGAKEIKVEITSETWSDFVFNDNYNLRSIKEIENYINDNNHLPDIPTAKEVEENGVNLGEMDAKLLQKIEELTLYMIQMNKEIENLKEENRTLKEQMNL